MEELLDSLWGLSALLENIALVAMLAGVIVVAGAFVKYYCKPDTEQNNLRLSRVWRGWVALGFALLVIGVALDGFAIWVRVSAPGRF